MLQHYKINIWPEKNRKNGPANYKLYEKLGAQQTPTITCKFFVWKNTIGDSIKTHGEFIAI